jgi:hypothetical protein
VEAAARVQTHATGPTYIRRQPEKTALYQVLQRHLLTFEQQWTDQANGRMLPRFVLDELHGTSGYCPRTRQPEARWFPSRHGLRMAKRTQTSRSETSGTSGGRSFCAGCSGSKSCAQNANHRSA